MVYTLTSYTLPSAEMIMDFISLLASLPRSVKALLSASAATSAFTPPSLPSRSAGIKRSSTRFSMTSKSTRNS